jgi:phosphate transport system protein
VYACFAGRPEKVCPTTEDELFKLLATRQPMARDLRELITVKHMVRDLERVGDQALAVMRKDLELEAEFRSALRRQSTFPMEHARNVGHVIDVVLALRALERIGGYAKNIGGYVVFLVTGEDVRHESLAAVEARLREHGG